MLKNSFRFFGRKASSERRKPRSQFRERCCPKLLTLEAREVPATAFLLSGSTADVAGVASNVSVTAVNADGSTDAAYTGTIHFSSSDSRAVLPGNTTLVNGAGSLPVTFLTAGTQTLTVTDTVNSTITGSLSSGGQAGPGFSQAPSASGGLVLSSWLEPDGSDADIYSYDNFTLSSNQAINAVDWRGGYQYGAPYGTAWDFSITIFDSTLGGTQPLVTNPQLPETFLAQYHVGGNAGETYVGTVGGIAMYDYHFALPTSFQAAGGHTYWLRIEASQTGYPDWGVALSTAGNNQHFQFSTGAAQFSYRSGDEAFALKTTEIGGVVVSPAATSQFVVSGLPSSVTAGTTNEFKVDAKDAYGNLTPAYVGTVQFASNDPQGVLPGDFYFASSNQGHQTFLATLKTAGDQWLSVTDKFNSAITGQGNVAVNPAAASSLAFAGFPASTTAGAAQAFTISAVDPFGNVAGNYNGTIHFTSSDPLAALPGNYLFTAGDAGVHAFSATLNTLGTQTLNATDIVNSALKGSVFTAGQTVAFNFDTGTPVLQPGMSIPANQTVNGVNAYFTSPNSGLSGGFSIQSQNQTFYNLSLFSGNYLYPNSVYNPNLAIAFSQPVSKITFTYATADFHQTEIPTTVKVTAYLGSTVVGTASSHGNCIQGDTMPQGTLTFDGAGQTFDHVLIEIPWAPLAASDMFIDNVVVVTPDVAGAYVNPAGQASTPSVVVDNNTFTYDGTAHSATATAFGIDGVTPIAGTFAFTYNGSPIAPTDAGSYAVVATFTSADPNYTNASGTGTLTINAVAPVFNNLSSPTVPAGTATVVLSGNLAAGSVFPSGGNVAITLNGVTQNATVDGSGNFSASFATGALAAGSYPITYAFAGDAGNFLAAQNGSGTLTVNPSAPQVTLHPKSQTVVRGTTVTFTAAAAGSPTPTVQWQVSKNGGKTWKKIRHATNATLSFVARLRQNGFQYRAVFTNTLGQAVTNAAVLTVTRS